MNLSSIVLGIDSSTQSTSAIVLNAASGKIEAEVRVNYKNDYRLKEYVLDPTTMVLPPLEPGEASQPAQMYLAALDACFSDLYKSCPNLIGKTEAINVSAQQHGQIWLSEKGVQSIYNLRSPMDNWKLTDYFADGFSSERAPIWMSSNSLKESMQIRKFVGGPNAITKISGSNSPVRFTGSVLDLLLRRGSPMLSKSMANIQAVDASMEAARALHIQRGDVLLVFSAHLYDAAGTVIDFSTSYFLPGYFRFHVVRSVERDAQFSHIF